MKSMMKHAVAVAASWMVSAQWVMAGVGDTPGGVRAVPEPGTIALVGLGVAAAILVAKRRK